MSVLVKGIDMPKSCGECRFLSFPYNVPVCSATREIFTYSLYQQFAQALKKRLDNCPLEEVEDEKPTTRYCDRNLCHTNEVNGIGCDECPVMMDEVTE